MTDYPTEIPPQCDKIARGIIETEDDYSDPRKDFTRYLTEVYIRFVNPHTYNPHNLTHKDGDNYKYWLGRALSCPKCVRMVWDYFIKRYKDKQDERG